MNNLAVIVDGYGPAKYFPQYFKKHGYECIHVQSTLEPLPALSIFNLNDYLINIIHDGNLQNTRNKLIDYAARKHKSIICVIPGIEPGVLLADQLSESLNLFSNGTEKSKARRDKFLMTEELVKHGIATVKYFKSNELDSILFWIQQNTVWPVVLKPLDSAGTNGVYVCQNPVEVEIAFNQIYKKVNNMGLINNEVLVQSFLKGKEYIINSVSFAGKHYISDIWYGRKKYISGHGFIYDREELLPYSGNTQDQLVSYVKTVLDALSIKYGPSHSEVMMTENGPVLIESGARIGGGVNPAVSDECLGHNQIELTVLAYTNPPLFDRQTVGPYQLKKEGMWVILASDYEGIVLDTTYLDPLKNLPSVRQMNIKVSPSDRLSKTLCLSTSPGSFHLAHQDKSIIERDYQTILSVFNNGLQLINSS